MSMLVKVVVTLMIGSGAIAALAVQQPSPSADTQADAPVTAEEARRTALALADVLEENYVSPDIARPAAMTRSAIRETWRAR
jgi:hypothetical protein